MLFDQNNQTEVPDSSPDTDICYFFGVSPTTVLGILLENFSKSQIGI